MHVNSDGFFGVVPIQVNKKENSATPINSDSGVFFFSLSIKCNASFLDVYITPKS